MSDAKTWDCPSCHTHEAMTNSDTFDAEWWCTVCDLEMDKHPVDYNNDE